MKVNGKMGKSTLSKEREIEEGECSETDLDLTAELIEISNTSLQIVDSPDKASVSSKTKNNGDLIGKGAFSDSSSPKGRGHVKQVSKSPDLVKNRSPTKSPVPYLIDLTTSRDLEDSVLSNSSDAGVTSPSSSFQKNGIHFKIGPPVIWRGGGQKKSGGRSSGFSRHLSNGNKWNDDDVQVIDIVGRNKLAPLMSLKSLSTVHRTITRKPDNVGINKNRKSSRFFTQQSKKKIDVRQQWTKELVNASAMQLQDLQLENNRNNGTNQLNPSKYNVHPQQNAKGHEKRPTFASSSTSTNGAGQQRMPSQVVNSKFKIGQAQSSVVAVAAPVPHLSLSLSHIKKSQAAVPSSDLPVRLVPPGFNPFFQQETARPAPQQCRTIPAGPHPWLVNKHNITVQIDNNQGQQKRSPPQRQLTPPGTQQSDQNSGTRFIRMKGESPVISINCNRGRPLLPNPRSSPPGMNRGNRRLVVIDGSNVAMGHGKILTAQRNGRNGMFRQFSQPPFSCRGIKICVEKIMEMGNPVLVFVPQNRFRKHRSVDTYILRDLENRGVLRSTPSRFVGGQNFSSYDDRFIIQVAHERDGIVLSNDFYRDLYDEQPKWRNTIMYRILQYTWIDEQSIMFPMDPLGDKGPPLDQFLCF